MLTLRTAAITAVNGNSYVVGYVDNNSVAAYHIQSIDLYKGRLVVETRYEYPGLVHVEELNQGILNHESIKDELPFPEPVYRDRPIVVVLTPEQLEPVHDHIRNGRKINAIKEFRNLTKCGLKESKDWVEANCNV